MVRPPQFSSSVDQKADVAFGYLAVTIFVLLAYILVIGRYINFTEHVLPVGDPFTYTANWFKLIDDTKGHYFRELAGVYLGRRVGWYRLMEVPIVALAPVLAKEPAVICIVNYLIWGLGTAAFLRLGHALGLSTGRAFLVALIPWVWPVNYGFADYSSMPVLALDSAFNGVTFLALGNSFVFALDPRRRKNAIIAAVSIGVAIWGRGNSLPIIGLVVAWPYLAAASTAWRRGDPAARRNVILVAIIAGAMTIEYYALNWRPITEYYGDYRHFIERHTWTLHDALPYLKNIPGFMYKRRVNAGWTMALSWLSHVVVLIPVWLAWRPQGVGASERHWAYRQLSAAGAFIYYATFMANLALWTDPQINLTNALLIWRPMLAGLSLSLVVLLSMVLDRLRLTRDNWMLIPAGVVLLAWGSHWTSKQTPWDWAVGRPSPRSVERFTLSLNQLLGGGNIAILWYGNYNMPILRYYRLKDDLGELPYFTGPNFSHMWSQLDFSPENRSRVMAEMELQFTQASFVLIAEYLDDYAPVQPYAFYHFKNDWAQWLNSPEAPRFRVRAVVQDTPGVRLLVLQREADAHGQGDPFRLPYGPRPSSPPPDYSAAVMRF